MARIIIADDHPLFRGALCQAVLKLWPQAELVEAETVAAARDAVNAEPADLLLLDLHMEDSDGLTALLDFRHDFPALPVVVVSASEESRVVRACQSLGASGFIPKSVDLDVMREALAQIRDGDVWFDADIIDNEDDAILFEKLASLTPAQRRILNLVSEGMLNKQIAYQMEISEATVKAHITAIFRKLDVVNRTQAVLVAKQLDVELPEVKSV
ncbi:response regulator transcription factor [Parasphingorhabdus litoris]|uniref:Response regulator transcription factor n=1 Tax=Parasphingorhabdus litoris TaxID=394733 RepID=A0ABN1A7H9_9SPHN|nr:response regulator transcription factor [Parasphingorhabdus litoris]